jgi:hypothetical protein
VANRLTQLVAFCMLCNTRNDMGESRSGGGGATYLTYKRLLLERGDIRLAPLYSMMVLSETKHCNEKQNNFADCRRGLS